MLFAKSGQGGLGESLHDHSMNVRNMARRLFDRLPATIRTEELWRELEDAALFHDVGKAATGFQEMLSGKRPDWNGRRHEVLSAGFASGFPVSEEVIFAVLTHHKQIPGSESADKGRLHWGVTDPEDWVAMLEEWLANVEDVGQLWASLCAECDRRDLIWNSIPSSLQLKLDLAWLDRRFRRQRDVILPERRVQASLLRGLLMGADHLASAGIVSIPPTIALNTFRPKFVLRGFQRACAVEGNVILNAPTGSGKTEAAIIWASANQPENGRFFYTLPYTAALNAIYARLQREFPGHENSIGLLHGRAAHHLYEAAQKDYPNDPEKATEEALARARLAKETLYPVRVCTPHQLLRFGLRGKGWEQMLSEIPGSCVVFDEVHSYDSKLAGLTLGTARLFASLGASLMFISATLPQFMRKYIRDLAPMSEIAPQERDPLDAEVLNRKRHVVTLIDGSILDHLAHIFSAVASGKRVLVVCNHVSSAQTVARILRRELGESEQVVCLFHSRFNMKDRKLKEGALASHQLPSVLVATQLVEVSLDISFDLGFFEPAPIDALVQRMGRVNRQGHSPAPVFIAKVPISSHRIYLAALVNKTLELLAERNGPLSECDLTEVCDLVYSEGYEGQDKQDFERRFNHVFLKDFKNNVVAGEHKDWIEAVIENEDGRADVLPRCLEKDYRRLKSQKLWLEADALLVNAYTSSLPKLDKSGERYGDPWIVDLKYDSKDGLQRTPSTR